MRPRCDHTGRPQGPEDREHGPVVALVRSRWSVDWYLCAPCLNEVLDWCDENAQSEPIAIAFRWNAEMPRCLDHPWAAVLCEDWPGHAAALELRGILSAVFPTYGGRT